MILGHLAVGFASKKLAPRTSLGTLMVAPILLDLLWPIALMLGLETVRIVPGITMFTPFDFVSYPWTHSLLMACAWGTMYGGDYYWRNHDLRASTVLVFGVVSHWILDWVVHRPDLQLSTWSEARYGLGLWNYPAATMTIELLMFAGGIAIYLGMTKARDRIGTFALWGFIGVMTLLYFGNAFGPPPPDLKSLKIFAFAEWLFVPWVYWIDRHRVNREANREAMPA
jgi:hypothetical protein